MDNLPVPQLELHWSLPARPWCSQDTLGRTVTPVRDYHSLPWLQKFTTAAGDHNLLLPPAQVRGRVQWFHRPPVREVLRVHVIRLRLEIRQLRADSNFTQSRYSPAGHPTTLVQGPHGGPQLFLAPLTPSQAGVGLTSCSRPQLATSTPP